MLKIYTFGIGMLEKQIFSSKYAFNYKSTSIMYVPTKKLKVLYFVLNFSSK